MSSRIPKLNQQRGHHRFPEFTMKQRTLSAIFTWIGCAVLLFGGAKTAFGQEWSEPVLLQGPLLQLPPTNKRFPSINATGDTIYFVAEDGNQDNIFYSYPLDDSTWAEATRIDELNDGRSKASVSIGPGDSILFFTAFGGEGSFGGWDVWVSRRGPGGRWQAAVNAGPNINSSGIEWGVFLNRRGDKLYFSSTRLPSGNGLNMLVSELVDGEWSEAVAISGEVNSHDDEEHVTLPEDESYLILTMGRWVATHIDLWTCYPTDSGWTEPDQIEELAGPGHEEGASLSPDGNTMYFGRQIEFGWNSRLFVTHRLPANVPRQEERIGASEIQVYPNPINGREIRVKLNQGHYHDLVHVRLYNIIGQSVLQETVRLYAENEFSLSLPELTTGRYFLTIQDAQKINTALVTIVK